MRFLSPLIYYLLILPVSLLPFPFLYGLSDFLFLVIYHLTPYRKKLVLENLKRSFPEKSQKELESIRRDFYRHFGDLVVESIKTFTASRKSIERRVRLENVELLESLYRQGKSVILASGHYANWEWPALTLPFHSSHTATGIYKKLSDPFFDKLLQRSRSRFGLKLMSTREVNSFFQDHAETLCTYGFINDQSPSDPRRGHWTKFLNQDTCLLMGVETYAKKYDMPVVYADIRKERRGHYSLTYRLVTAEPLKTREFEITEACSAINESIIREQPAYWLWTHRRWKHRKPD